MGHAMGGTELSSLPLAPTNRDRLLRAGFRTLRDVEGVQPLDLSRGAVQSTAVFVWIFLEVLQCTSVCRVVSLGLQCALLFCLWIFLEVRSTAL